MMSVSDSEELSKKSYEVVVHLNAKGVSNCSSDSELSDEEGRPVCNTWKGKNHELHVVGNFKSDFIKRLKRYQVPATVPLSMDTFCRVEADYPKGDPIIDEAFLLWECPEFEALLKNRSERKQNEIPQMDENDGDGDIYDENESKAEENLEDSCLETEQEIEEYIKSQQLKKLQGDNVTGEILIFDEDHDMVRNLHTDSISLTCYGIPDEKIFGKTELLFDKLSLEEKCLLKVREIEKDSSGSENVNLEGLQAETGGSGDCTVKITNKA